MTNPVEIIKAHHASITDKIEFELYDRYTGDGNEDIADFALRECSCGERVEDFYAYNDHLAAVLEQAIT